MIIFLITAILFQEPTMAGRSVQVKSTILPGEAVEFLAVAPESDRVLWLPGETAVQFQQFENGRSLIIDPPPSFLGKFLVTCVFVDANGNPFKKQAVVQVSGEIPAESSLIEVSRDNAPEYNASVVRIFRNAVTRARNKQETIDWLAREMKLTRPSDSWVSWWTVVMQPVVNAHNEDHDVDLARFYEQIALGVEALK